MLTDRRKKKLMLAGLYGGAGAAGKLLVTALGGWLLYKFFKMPAASSQTEANLKAAVAAGRPNAELTKIAMSDPNIATYSQNVGNDPSKTTEQKVAAVTSAVTNLISSVKGSPGLGGLGLPLPNLNHLVKHAGDNPKFWEPKVVHGVVRGNLLALAEAQRDYEAARQARGREGWGDMVRALRARRRALKGSPGLGGLGSVWMVRPANLPQKPKGVHRHAWMRSLTPEQRHAVRAYYASAAL